MNHAGFAGKFGAFFSLGFAGPLEACCQGKGARGPNPVWDLLVGHTVDGSEIRRENHRLDGAKTRRK